MGSGGVPVSRGAVKMRERRLGVIGALDMCREVHSLRQSSHLKGEAWMGRVDWRLRSAGTVAIHTTALRVGAFQNETMID